MALRPAIVPLLAAMLAAGGCGDSGPGPAYSPAGGRFTVAFPAAFGPPSETVRTWSRGAATTELHTWTAAGVEGCAFVAYSDQTFDKDRPAVVPEALDRASRQAVEALDGKLSAGPTDAGSERPTREFRFTAGSPTTPLIGRGRVVAVAGRIYQVVLMGARESDLDRASAKAFFESFRIQAPEAAPAKSPLSQPPPADNLRNE